MIKAIVFDFDGVIVDSEPLHFRAFLHISRRFGHEFDYKDYLKRYVGYDDRDAFRVMLCEAAGKRDATPEDYTGSESQIALLVEEKAGAFEHVVEQGIETIEGMREFVQAAAGQIPVAIASGATRADIDLILRKIGLADRFATIVSASDVEHSKPDPQTYRMAVEQLAKRHPALMLTPETCLAIEDTAAGIESARGAGLSVLGLTTTTTSAALHRAHRVVPSFAGLTLEQLQQWFS